MKRKGGVKHIAKVLAGVKAAGTSKFGLGHLSEALVK
jgi:hypothetical protein